MVRYLRLPHVRLALFLVLAAAAFPLSAILTGVMGASGRGAAAWFGAVLSGALILATVLAAKLSGERLVDIGFAASTRQGATALLAFVVGASAFAMAALVLGRVASGVWIANPSASAATALAGLVPVLCLFFSEELLFRGYAFQQLRRIYGTRSALVFSAALFGAYHLVGSGDWAMGAVFRFLLPALGGLVFGYALVRTGSLAVPIGLHWGGNWVQTMVFGLGQTPGNASALVVMPLAPDQIRMLAAPDVLPHVPYLAALACAVLFLRWQPRRPGLTSA